MCVFVCLCVCVCLLRYIYYSPDIFCFTREIDLVIISASRNENKHVYQEMFLKIGNNTDFGDSSSLIYIYIYIYSLEEWFSNKISICIGLTTMNVECLLFPLSNTSYLSIPKSHLGPISKFRKILTEDYFIL